MDRLTVLVPETKRTTVDKAVVGTETITFKTKNGKKMTIPRSSLLLQEENAITYKFPRRKVLKGNFKAVGDGMQDKESGLFAAMESVVIAEPATAGTKKKKTDVKKKKKKKN